MAVSRKIIGCLLDCYYGTLIRNCNLSTMGPADCIPSPTVSSESPFRLEEPLKFQQKLRLRVFLLASSSCRPPKAKIYSPLSPVSLSLQPWSRKLDWTNGNVIRSELKTNVRRTQVFLRYCSVSFLLAIIEFIQVIIQ